MAGSGQEAKMPTFSGGEHFLRPVSQGDVQRENQIRRKRSRQNPVLGYYFVERSKSRKKARPPNWPQIYPTKRLTRTPIRGSEAGTCRKGVSATLILTPST
jgi:hypothetical protein